MITVRLFKDVVPYYGKMFQVRRDIVMPTVAHGMVISGAVYCPPNTGESMDVVKSLEFILSEPGVVYACLDMDNYCHLAGKSHEERLRLYSRETLLAGPYRDWTVNEKGQS